MMYGFMTLTPGRCKCEYLAIMTSNAYRPVDKKDRFPFNGKHICAKVRKVLKEAGLAAPFKFSRSGSEGENCVIGFDETYEDASRAVEVCTDKVGPWFSGLVCRLQIGATKPGCYVCGTVYANRVAYKSLDFVTGF